MAQYLVTFGKPDSGSEYEAWKEDDHVFREYATDVIAIIDSQMEAFVKGKIVKWLRNSDTQHEIVNYSLRGQTKTYGVVGAERDGDDPERTVLIVCTRSMKYDENGILIYDAVVDDFGCKLYTIDQGETYESPVGVVD